MAGKDGKGTMSYQWKGPTKKDIIGTGKQSMPEGYKGRVLYSNPNKGIGRQEGTGPES